MFVRNDTTERIALAKGHLTEGLAAGAIVVESVYRVLANGLARMEEPPPREPSDPPDPSRTVLWSEVSVTASGTALGPSRPPHVCPVSLTIGQDMRRVIVFGARRYLRRLDGELEPSPPEPFEGIPMSWERAFGGGYTLPPGLMPGSGLPHPGIHVCHPINRFGVGLYADKKAATDQPVPNVERPDRLIRRWDDQPTPAGFAPCPELQVLRLPQRYGGHGRDLPEGSAAVDPTEAMGEDFPLVTLRMQHHAPGDLIFPDLPPGTPIALAGLGSAALRVRVPGSPVSVRTRRRRQEEAVPPRLRSLHLDADRATLTVVYGHIFSYDPARPPSWVLVAAAS